MAPALDLIGVPSADLVWPPLSMRITALIQSSAMPNRFDASLMKGVQRAVSADVPADNLPARPARTAGAGVLGWGCASAGTATVKTAQTASISARRHERYDKVRFLLLQPVLRLFACFAAAARHIFRRSSKSLIRNGLLFRNAAYILFRYNPQESCSTARLPGFGDVARKCPA